MKTCREIQQSFREEPEIRNWKLEIRNRELVPNSQFPIPSFQQLDSETRQHLADCPHCAREYRFIRLERKLLAATLPGERALELSPDFLVRLRARLGQLSGERGIFWEWIWGFSKPFAIVAMVLLLFLGGLNLYTVSNQESVPPRYLLGPVADDLDVILSEDLALTQERVLHTLVTVRGKENGNQQ